LSKHIILLFLLIFGFIFLFEIPALGTIWKIETVDSAGWVGQWTSIALDSSNYPHISYYDEINHTLKYARWTGSTWETEIVDSGVDVYMTSIALDSSNYPHISYHDYTNRHLKYAKWTGSTWETETVDSDGEVGEYTSIALDSSDYPHISYHDYTNRDLKYAKWTGSTWETEIADSGVWKWVGRYTSIALDSSDRPHISYYNDIDNDLKYARWTGSTWGTETVDFAVDVGEWTSIALDSSDYPHISYLDDTNNHLKYARWTGSTWETEIADSTGDVGWCTSIALDNSNYPHISYYDDTNNALKYARWTGSTWETEIVDSDGNVGSNTSIALDGNNEPHISYYDNSNFDLKYTTFSPMPEVTNVSATQNSTGKVNITYDVDDNQEASTIISFQYWNGSTTVECATTNGEGLVPNGTGRIGTWEPKSDFGDQFMNNCRIWVTSDDGAGGIGTGESSTFILDTKDPTNVNCLSPANGEINVFANPILEAQIAADDSPIQYRFQLNTLESFDSPLQDSGYQPDKTWNPSTLYPLTIYFWRVRVKDSKGNETISSSASFETQTDFSPPTISNVRFNDRIYVEGDIISVTPRITATITDETYVATVEIKVDDDPSIDVTGSLSDSSLYYQMADKLGDGTHTIRINASDLLGNEGTKECTVKVIAGPTRVLGPVLSYPAVFKPLTGTGDEKIARIAYTLTTDANITIYMYDISGQVVLTRKFRAGGEGGRAGYNGVIWDGITDFGSTIGNGVYMYKIISGGKVIGTGKLVVYD